MVPGLAIGASKKLPLKYEKSENFRILPLAEVVRSPLPEKLGSLRSLVQTPVGPERKKVFYLFFRFFPLSFINFFPELGGSGSSPGAVNLGFACSCYDLGGDFSLSGMDEFWSDCHQIHSKLSEASNGGDLTHPHPTIPLACPACRQARGGTAKPWPLHHPALLHSELAICVGNGRLPRGCSKPV